MLTATYSIVAISVEQADVRARLNAFHQLIRSTFEAQAALAPDQVAHACDAMRGLYEAFGCRRVERFLIPALHALSDTADRLLAELDALRRSAGAALEALCADMRAAAPATPAEVARFCAEAGRFCDALLGRLDREEHELMPLARVTVPISTWFAIAHQILAVDARHDPRRDQRSRRALAGARMPVPPRAAPARAELARSLAN